MGGPACRTASSIKCNAADTVQGTSAHITSHERGCSRRKQWRIEQCRLRASAEAPKNADLTDDAAILSIVVDAMRNAIMHIVCWSNGYLRLTSWITVRRFSARRVAAAADDAAGGGPPAANMPLPRLR